MGILMGFAANLGPHPASCGAGEKEPPAINPFAPVRHEREDALPGYLEMSDGRRFVGNIYMTRDKRLKLWDAESERQREIPLRAVKQIDCHVEKEWMEKEWRFKESALDEKVYTGRTYPVRVYTHTVTLQDGRKITGPLAEILYVQPIFESASGPMQDSSQLRAQRFILHKRDKGEIGTELKSLHYVRLVKLGAEALEEGKRKAAQKTLPAAGQTPPTPTRARPPGKPDG
ncbi:MAG: hypothetical protein ACUVUC_02005 [Thermoguttaceae bacterium]